MDRVKFGLLGFGLEYALCGFECLVFRVLGSKFKCLGVKVRVFQISFDF